MIFTGDHKPMHVHVYCQGRKAVIEFEANIRIRKNQGLNRREMKQAVSIVTNRRAYLIQKWREIYDEI